MIITINLNLSKCYFNYKIKFPFEDNLKYPKFHLKVFLDIFFFDFIDNNLVVCLDKYHLICMNLFFILYCDMKCCQNELTYKFEIKTNIKPKMDEFVYFIAQFCRQFKHYDLSH